MIRVFNPRMIGGEVQVPGSKSATHRAIICAMLGRGKSLISFPSKSKDIEIFLRLVSSFGVQIKSLHGKIEIESNIDFSKPCSKLSTVLNCQSSLLNTRTIAVLASLYSEPIKLSADQATISQVYNETNQVLSQLGVNCSILDNVMTVCGPIKANDLCIDAKNESQFASVLLLAMSLLPKISKISIKNIRKMTSLGLTLDVARAFSCIIKRENDDFYVGKSKFIPCNYNIESDWMYASYFLTAGAISSITGLDILGIKQSSSQPEIIFLDVLKLADARMEYIPGGYRIRLSKLKPFTYDAKDYPEMLPVLVSLAARCEGKSIITGVYDYEINKKVYPEIIVDSFKAVGLAISYENNSIIVDGFGLSGKYKKQRIVCDAKYSIATFAVIIASLGINEPLVIEKIERLPESYYFSLDLLEKMSI